eukprot:294723-Amphidinium_carterae.1
MPNDSARACGGLTSYPEELPTQHPALHIMASATRQKSHNANGPAVGRSVGRLFRPPLGLQAQEGGGPEILRGTALLGDWSAPTKEDGLGEMLESPP